MVQNTDWSRLQIPGFHQPRIPIAWPDLEWFIHGGFVHHRACLSTHHRLRTSSAVRDGVMKGRGRTGFDGPVWAPLPRPAGGPCINATSSQACASWCCREGQQSPRTFDKGLRSIERHFHVCALCLEAKGVQHCLLGATSALAPHQDSRQGGADGSRAS